MVRTTRTFRISAGGMAKIFSDKTTMSASFPGSIVPFRCSSKAAKALFTDWLSKSEDAEQKVFLEGLLLAEERATEDLRAAFLATWTPKVVSGLKRQFRDYC